MFFKKEIEIPVDVEKLKKELLSLSKYAILEDERKIEDLRYLLNGAMFGDGSYTSEAGMQNSLIVALSIIFELQSAQQSGQVEL